MRPLTLMLVLAAGGVDSASTLIQAITGLVVAVCSGAAAIITATRSRRAERGSTVRYGRRHDDEPRSRENPL